MNIRDMKTTRKKKIKADILSYLVQNKLISKTQHGFVPNKSCTTNLLESLDTMKKILDDKLDLDFIFLGSAKAFDNVNCQYLIVKLASHDIEGALLNWIEPFLNNRRKRVVTGDSVSNRVPKSSGVPQVSVFEPLLFAICINELPEVVKALAKLFADDRDIFGKL